MKNTKVNRALLAVKLTDITRQLTEKKIDCNTAAYETLSILRELNREQIYVVWDIADVIQLKRMPKHNAIEILQDVYRGHDASMGINWDTLQCSIDYNQGG